MKNIVVWLCILVMGLFCFLAPPAVVFAQEEDGFQEAFDDTTLPGWEHSQNVLVTDGVLRIDPDNFAFRQGRWENPELSVRIRFTTPGGVVLHYHASDRGVYRLHITGEGENLEAALEKEVEGSITSLAKAPLSNFKSGEWNTVRISFSGNTHKIMLNDAEVFNVGDDTPLPGGAVGFFAFGAQAVEVDDLIVNVTSTGFSVSPGGEIPPEQEPVLEQALPPASIQSTPLVTPQAGTGKRSLIEEMFVTGANPVDLTSFVINLGLSALLAFLLGRVYIYWGASLSNRRKFAANFMLMTVTTTFIILVVRSSVALSLGLVGALSIVRFRAAIKEPEELAYLFLAIGLGIGFGDNQRLITLLAFSVAVIVLGIARLLRRTQADVNMHLNIAAPLPGTLDLDQIMAVLSPHCAKIKLLRFDESEKGLEVSFLVELTDVRDLSQARNALHALAPTLQITFLDNKGIW